MKKWGGWKFNVENFISLIFGSKKTLLKGENRLGAIDPSLKSAKFKDKVRRENREIYCVCVCYSCQPWKEREIILETVRKEYKQPTGIIERTHCVINSAWVENITTTNKKGKRQRKRIKMNKVCSIAIRKSLTAIRLLGWMWCQTIIHCPETLITRLIHLNEIKRKRTQHVNNLGMESMDIGFHLLTTRN